MAFVPKYAPPPGPGQSPAPRRDDRRRAARNVRKASALADPVNGKQYDVSQVIDSTGAARLDFNVGNVGEHTIEGKFTFLENIL